MVQVSREHPTLGYKKAPSQAAAGAVYGTAAEGCPPQPRLGLGLRQRLHPERRQAQSLQSDRRVHQGMPLHPRRPRHQGLRRAGPAAESDRRAWGPECIRSDNGPEFIAKAIQQWLKGNGIKTLYIDPGCPWQNGYAESFNSRFREECLDRELIYTLSESRVVFSDWRDYYNKQRPHRSLGLLTPSEFATKQIEAPSRSGRPTGSLRRKDKNNNINHENPFENLSLEPG